MNPGSDSWQIGPADPSDIEQIEGLIASVGGDLDRLTAEQFTISRDPERKVIGCVRLKPYPDFYELASLAVSNKWRGRGIGRGMIIRLLETHPGPIYLICEDQVIEFFRQFRFDLISITQLLPGLESKIAKYTAEAGHINIMRRD